MARCLRNLPGSGLSGLIERKGLGTRMAMRVLFIAVAILFFAGLALWVTAELINSTYPSAAH
ncbi:hypothetical protein [Mesorhizobium sp. INR15]|uniref:hypothetical protein n=1 Tax=Mesorhizobium sp. INR15 TaxID=2654248 RepID=UPI00189682E9|nr:hypothetical protein [Mesorhizobium sp. INR15]QPC91602.1 hypothetical protein GA829_13895 [Mesorhizobium sp. INR15]